MKKLLLIIPFILSGCGVLDSLFSISSTPTTAKDVYDAAGGTGIHLIQVDNTGAPLQPVVSTPPRIIGRVVYLDLPSCNYSFDFTGYSDIDYFLTQPITIDYDPNIVVCGSMNFQPVSVEMVGTEAIGKFTAF